jgi:hypothetical protein
MSTAHKNRQPSERPTYSTRKPGILFHFFLFSVKEAGFGGPEPQG